MCMISFLWWRISAIFEFWSSICFTFLANFNDDAVSLFTSLVALLIFNSPRKKSTHTTQKNHLTKHDANESKPDLITNRNLTLQKPETNWTLKCLLHGARPESPELTVKQPVARSWTLQPAATLQRRNTGWPHWQKKKTKMLSEVPTFCLSLCAGIKSKIG